MCVGDFGRENVANFVFEIAIFVETGPFYIFHLRTKSNVSFFFLVSPTYPTNLTIVFDIFPNLRLKILMNIKEIN